MKQDKIQEAYEKILNEDKNDFLSVTRLAADNIRDDLKKVIDWAKEIKNKKAVKNLKSIYKKIDEEFNFLEL